MSTETSAPQLRPHFTPEPHRWIRPFGAPPPYCSKSRSWIHILGFAVVMAATVYVILDIEYPRLGLIRVESADQVLVELRESMK
jgi:hypothetical protein